MTNASMISALPRRRFPRNTRTFQRIVMPSAGCDRKGMEDIIVDSLVLAKNLPRRDFTVYAPDHKPKDIRRCGVLRTAALPQGYCGLQNGGRIGKTTIPCARMRPMQ